MLTLDKIYHAAYVLKPVARKTDVIYAAKLSQGYDLYLKTENLQLTGSFKLRGAYYKISQLNEEQRKAGIIACSAGNHAQGVALAASRMGIKAIVCMPDGAPISKVEATKALGAEVCLVKGAYDDAYNYACQLQQETGMTFIHPFNDEEVIAGQGTIGLEILDQLPDVDAVVCSIGGGGLISGVACAIKSLNPKVKVYGVQAENAPSMKRSLEAGEAITLDSVRTFADGIAVKHPGDITLDMVRKYVDEVVTVSEDEIAAAILALMEKQKLVAEGAGAVTVAAAMFGKLPIAGKKVCCLISGGNIDVNILSRVITRGLQREGRNCLLTIALDDKPGQLLGVTQVISECGANIVGVTHERSDAAYAVTSCLLRISMETRDFAQIEEMVSMGGNYKSHGNCSPVAEYNYWCDPDAAHIVYEAFASMEGKLLHMIGLDVTRQIVLTPNILQYMRYTNPVMGERITNITKFYLDFHWKQEGIIGCVINDPLAVAYFIDRNLCQGFASYATVETQGISIGQTLVDTYHFWNKPDNSYILTQTDAYGFMKFFLQRVINAPESEIERILKTI